MELAPRRPALPNTLTNRYQFEYEGNRWSTIAARLSCPNDNSVKNKFYSTIRRGFRKLNKYITQIKRRRSASHLSCNKLIKGEFIVKVTAVADKTYEDKYEVKPIAVDLSQGRLFLT